jgi:hypothetical protein
MAKGFPQGSVCKPCWELRYCPYGPLVEQFPLIPTSGTVASSDLEEIRKYFEENVQDILSGRVKTKAELLERIDRLLYLDPSQWEEARKYDAPEIECRIWGHVCPVFFTQSGATETKIGRKQGRSIPREIMLKVVRRDNHVCQICFRYVPDNEVEFDHKIPLSKGGPTAEANIRLLCRECNRKRGNSVADLLRE